MLQHIAPWFGYLASLLLIIALLVSNDLKFRWFNTLGNIVFISYAIVIAAIPVLLTNSILLCINLYHLIKIYRKQENFDLLEFKGDEKLVFKFLEFYGNDINAYFPEFDAGKLIGNLNFVVIRDLVIANIFSAKVDDNGDANILINYTTEKYRDYKVGTYIFEKEKDFLISRGVKRIVYKEVFNRQHSQFLKIMGFINEGVLVFKNL
jgi:hypothetical protein